MLIVALVVLFTKWAVLLVKESLKHKLFFAVAQLAKFSFVFIYILQLLSQSDIKWLESFCLSSVVGEFIFCLLITKLSFCSHQENSVTVGCGFTAKWERNPCV